MHLNYRLKTNDLFILILSERIIIFITNIPLPTGKSDEEFVKVAKTIEAKVKDLVERIKNNNL